MNFYSINEKYFFYNFPVILFILIPFFLITGPFLSDLSISLIALIFLFYCLKNRNFSYFKNRYFYFFLIFWVYLVFNSLVNNINIHSFKISLFFFRFGVFVIAVVALLKFDQKFLKYFFYCILICFIALIIDGFYQYFVGENILGFRSPNRSRVSSFFNEEMILGSYLSRIWPIFFGLSIFIIKQKTKLFFLFFMIFVLSETLIFLSGDRTAFFYINLSAIFVIIFSRGLVKLRLLTLLSSVLLISIISFINPVSYERVVIKTAKSIMPSTYNDNDNDNENKKKIYIFTKTHHEIYTSAYKMFLDNKILGVGIKNFRNKCSDTRYYVGGREICYTHPHNTYVQILTEIGIVGFVFLLTVLYYFCKYLIKHLRLKIKRKYFFNDFQICILSGLAIYLWPFVPTGNFFNNWLNIIFFTYLPFLIWSKNIEISKISL